MVSACMILAAVTGFASSRIRIVKLPGNIALLLLSALPLVWGVADVVPLAWLTILFAVQGMWTVQAMGWLYAMTSVESERLRRPMLIRTAESTFALGSGAAAMILGVLAAVAPLRSGTMALAGAFLPAAVFCVRVASARPEAASSAAPPPEYGTPGYGLRRISGGFAAECGTNAFLSTYGLFLSASIAGNPYCGLGSARGGRNRRHRYLLLGQSLGRWAGAKWQVESSRLIRRGALLGVAAMLVLANASSVYFSLAAMLCAGIAISNAAPVLIGMATRFHGRRGADVLAITALVSGCVLHLLAAEAQSVRRLDLLVFAAAFGMGAIWVLTPGTVATVHTPAPLALGATAGSD